MTKLLNKAKTNKTTTKVTQEYPRSYRLDPEIMATLKATLARINEASPKKISEARLVKALIQLSSEIDNDRLLKAIKEVW